MSGRTRGVPLPRAVDAVLKEFVNALGKSAMYPAGHRFVLASAGALAERLAAAMADRDSLTIGVLPRGLLLDGAAIEPLPLMLREFAVRLHRKNVGTIQVERGVTSAEVVGMLTALAAPDADERVGREGVRLEHLRIEPLVYDVLAFADPLLDRELDDVFWVALVEAAFGRRLTDGESVPTTTQIAEAISERAATSAEGARRVFEALASFSSALASRGERAAGTARRRFVEVLSALSRPTTTRVVKAAPSSASRRRFLRETLELVPPALLLQLLESVAEADGEPISPYLRWLLGKLAGGEGPGELPASGAFATEVLGLVEQWDGVGIEDDEETDPRLGLEPARVLAMGLDLNLSSALVVYAARSLAARGQLIEVLQLLDNPENHPESVRIISEEIFDPGLLERLLRATPIDFPLIDRVAKHTGAGAVGALLDALSLAGERATRRRLLDTLVRVGPDAERELLQRLTGAPWYLARNILGVLANFPDISDLEPVFEAFRQVDLRVRQEALRVLVRQPAARERAIAEAFESGEVALMRMALASLNDGCPPRLVALVLSVLAHPNDELRLQAIRAIADSNNPLIVPQLLALVRARRGLLRRPRLVHKSAVMLAALEVLARRWANHRPVLSVLQLAMKSGDAEIRAIASAPPA